MKKPWMATALSMGVCAVVLGAALHPSALQAKRSEGNDAYYQELDLFGDALKIVQEDYVEEAQAERLIYGALKGMLATLDPYSQFLDPDSYNELRVETEGQFGGLGIEITIRDDLLTVISPIDGSPAHQAGMKSGDRIVKIDGAITRGITLLDAVKKLRGKPGTSVKLTVLREGARELKEFTLTRESIKIQSIRDVQMVDASIGYIRLSDFRENTPRDLEQALTDLTTKGMESLVLDLRNDPGGLLDVAVTTSEVFLDRHQLIVSTKGRLKNQNLEFRTREKGRAGDLPLVVLINEGSASASEIVAGALQDHHRAVIMGTKSHGKASVQTIFPLKDGSALRLTTSKYFTPNGRSIHGQGIEPDVMVPFQEPPAKEQAEDKTPAPNADDVFDELEHKEPDAVTHKLATDNQLARAVDLLKGLKVYQHVERAIQ
jgi:carboxyl-terminal processing protease